MTVTDTEVAEAAAAAVTAATDPADPYAGLESSWHAYLVIEGMRTTDHRAIAPEALVWRELPWPLYAQFDNAGHEGAPIVGKVDTVERQPGSTPGTFRLYATGTWDMVGPGAEAARLCADQIMRFGSIDLEVLDSRYVEVTVDDGSEPMMDDGLDFLDLLFGAPGTDDWYEEVTSGRIMGYTMVGMPAFPQAVIAPLSVALPDVEPMTTGDPVSILQPNILASAVDIDVPLQPPASWFPDKAFLDGPTPLTITADGRIYGHAALWGVCHTGIEKVCTVAEPSPSGYAYFRTGRMECADGSFAKVGQITMGTGHANISLRHSAAAAHYDNTGWAVADITMGEDDHGVWYSGCLRPGTTAETVRELRASSVSGDWRLIGGGLEMVALLAVNVPGFPVVAAGRHMGEQVSLLASAYTPRRPDRLTVLASEVRRLRSIIMPLMPLARAEVLKRVHG